jgi:valyl-tRNA synthetase
MSKSLGTGIDPLEVIGEYGADAVRYGLLKMSSTQDVRFSYGAVEEGRKLANKLWNVSRLILANVGDAAPAVRPTEVTERWILARLEVTRAEIEECFAAFDYAGVVTRLYHLTFDEFCDWYAEAIKPRLYDEDEDARSTALAALERLLALLHPVMPHVTEEIWSNLADRKARLIVSPWPTADGAFAADANALERVQDAAAIFRRSGLRVHLTDDEERIFQAVVRPERMKIEAVSVEAETGRLNSEVARCEKMLSNQNFVGRARPEVVDAEREKLARYRRELDALCG